MGGLTTLADREFFRVQRERGAGTYICAALELALLNLAANTRDAMSGAGRLTIVAREELDAMAGACVVLSVTDTGVGMDEATLAQAAEPFFITEGIGRGTGLGLSMVHGLTAQSGGKLVLRSVPYQGTTAELWLPRTETAAPMLTRKPAGVIVVSAHSARRSTVLVVDDDALLLASAEAMLEDPGRTTIGAASGRQALDILRAGARVDLVVGDQSMPGMTGIQLAAEMRRVDPTIPVLLMTGFFEREEVMASNLPLLPKPFEQAALADAIGTCLQAPVGNKPVSDRKVVAFRAGQATLDSPPMGVQSPRAKREGRYV